MRRALLALILSAAPVLAETPGPAVIVELLRDETPEARLAGAILACAEIVYDPAIAEGLFIDGAWEAADAEFEGTAEYWTDGLWAMHWHEPGFCMVETDAMGTEAALGVILAATEDWPGMQILGTDGEECAVIDLGQGTLLQLTGEGQDPACTSETGAALRFTIGDT
ncbi:MAG: hypothetical protein KF887_05735 [Paracoccaceae bacterium]|nr:MAG: hypothetical protein KF887_05735 [Paracoccaceae bacterium]